MLTPRVLLQCIASELIWLRIARGRALTQELTALSEFAADIPTGNRTIALSSRDGEREESREGKILGFHVLNFAFR
jgi:hypothetical protein